MSPQTQAPLEPVTRTLFRNRVSADGIQCRIYDEVVLDEGGPTPRDGCPHKRQKSRRAWADCQVLIF